MKKIPCIFIRDHDNGGVTRQANPETRWVGAGEGVPTRKYDGTSCMIDERGSFYKRRMVRPNKEAPVGFIECTVDPNTGKRFGWVPVREDEPGDKYHLEAWFNYLDQIGEKPPQGTYELIGPNVQGNPENVAWNHLQPHADAEQYEIHDRTYDGLRAFLADSDIEGLVFHHPDGRMAKIRKKDFGLER